jgi:hypothetical protein
MYNLPATRQHLADLRHAAEVARHQLRRLSAIRQSVHVTLDAVPFHLRVLDLELATQSRLADLRQEIAEREEWLEELRQEELDRFRYLDGDHHEERDEHLPEYDYPG